MTTKTLFLAWQDRANTRQWFPVGRLDANLDCSKFQFRYINGAKRAQEEVGFLPLLEFPELERDYRSSDLFPIFQNRVMTPRRPDFPEYLRSLDLEENADPIEILSANGGRRVTDSFEVFPELVKNEDGSFVCRFFLHGLRYVSEPARGRVSDLKPDEQLHIALELTNPTGHPAVQIQTVDYQMIGWTPRYLVDDLTRAMAEAPGKYTARVVRVNPVPMPSRQRVLVELKSYWQYHEPMTGKDFTTLV